MIWAARVTQHTNLIIIITTLPSSTLCDLLSFFRNSLILHVVVYQTHAINNQHVNSISTLYVFSWYKLNSTISVNQFIFVEAQNNLSEMNQRTSMGHQKSHCDNLRIIIPSNSVHDCNCSGSCWVDFLHTMAVVIIMHLFPQHWNLLSGGIQS